MPKMARKQVDRTARAALASATALIGLMLILVGYEVFVRDSDPSWDAPSRGVVFVPLFLPIPFGIWFIALLILEPVLKRLNLFKGSFLVLFVSSVSVLFGFALTVGLEGDWAQILYQFVLAAAAVFILIGSPLAVWWRVLQNES
jgi:hypothetical protein